ncbi:hypothetical protein [Brevibacillus reuszeri]|uniref:hypothetical protein n=1 Tax=Brevibacillus reuszeri TaxID=54915 RepID=UPI003D1B5288
MNSGFLKQWCLTHEVETRSINSFWNGFRNYQSEVTEEFNSVFGVDFKTEDLTISLKEVALFIDRWDENITYEDISYGFDYVASYIPIVYKNKKLGWYKLLFNLDGEIFDDFFVID